MSETGEDDEDSEGEASVRGLDKAVPGRVGPPSDAAKNIQRRICCEKLVLPADPGRPDIAFEKPLGVQSLRWIPHHWRRLLQWLHPATLGPLSTASPLDAAWSGGLAPCPRPSPAA